MPSLSIPSLCPMGLLSVFHWSRYRQLACERAASVCRLRNISKLNESHWLLLDYIQLLVSCRAIGILLKIVILCNKYKAIEFFDLPMATKRWLALKANSNIAFW